MSKTDNFGHVVDSIELASSPGKVPVFGASGELKLTGELESTKALQSADYNELASSPPVFGELANYPKVFSSPPFHTPKGVETAN